MNKRSMFTLANVLVFQLGWFVCILLGSYLALVFTLVALLLHLVFSPVRRADIVAIIVMLLLGIIHDSILLLGGLIAFPGASLIPPVWLMCLWILLGLTLNHSLAWIYSRPLWSAITGALAAPLSYWAGIKLSPAELASPAVLVLPIIATLWLLILPLHRFLCARIFSYVDTLAARSTHANSRPE